MMTHCYPAALTPLRDIDALMSSMLGASAPLTARRLPGADRASIDLPIALREDAQSFYLDADLPGVRLDQVDITFDRGTLTLRAARQLPTVEGQEVRHSERFEGEMVRAITLGRGVDADKITAEMRDGVLTVTLPKLSDQTGRKIAVRATPSN